ncbi:hypothetical protein [Desulfotomaculum nigrificans]|uniref:hypothetical protein n=1 Tax=Desulfotomaculum nigrificans TaxID=1565 RepID=UPI0001FAE566|nr:hypothetical protein [Desulfotomaculum nigrificans]MDA8235918.1 hypothetical protein [Clostridia bacterium]
MQIKQKEKVLQIYEKRLTIHWNQENNQNIARIYDYREVELCKPLHFKNSKEGYKSLLLWVKNISHTANKASCSLV